MKQVVVFASLLLLAGSCRWWNGGVNPPPIGPGIFPVRVGTTLNLPLYGLTLTYVRTVGDGRCPLDAVCVWPGVADIDVNARLRTGAQADFMLSIPGYVTAKDNWHMPFDTLGFRFTLMQLDPYPMYAGLSDSTKYVAHIRIEKLQ